MGNCPRYLFYGGPYFFKEERLICYIREEAKQVYIRINMADLRELKPLEGACSWFTIICLEDGYLGDCYDEVALYNFDAEATNLYWGTVRSNWKYNISSVEKVDHNGTQLNKYNIDIEDKGEDASYYEIIGSDDIFFLPFAGLSLMSTRHSVLRYVTDPDGTIIYKGYGGFKLWEEYAIAGVDNVETAGMDVTEWYDMHGRRIERPTQNGVYIKRQGRQVTKVVL